jgi:hypothetical protein
LHAVAREQPLGKSTQTRFGGTDKKQDVSPVALQPRKQT